MSDPLLGYRDAGLIPGGPVDACWDWEVLSCEPCDASNKDGLEVSCNQTYSECQEYGGREVNVG
jgi:hypothetical protein